MKEEIVSLEVAKLAKERGFVLPCNNFYFEDGEFRNYVRNENYGYYGEPYTIEINDVLENWNDNFLTKKNGDRCFGCSKSNGYLETYSAPTQSLLQKWIREVHNIHLDIWYNFLTSKWRNEAIINLLTDKNYDFLDDKEYDSYELALEEGLKESLKLINL